MVALSLALVVPALETLAADGLAGDDGAAAGEPGAAPARAADLDVGVAGRTRARVAQLDALVRASLDRGALFGLGGVGKRLAAHVAAGVRGVAAVPLGVAQFSAKATVLGRDLGRRLPTTGTNPDVLSYLSSTNGKSTENSQKCVRLYLHFWPSSTTS